MSTRTRVARRVVIAMAVTAASVLAWPWLAAWQRGRFAEELARRAAESTNLSVESVRDMWPLGQSATGPLVELAAAQRPELAVAAQDAIADQLAAWEIEFASGGDGEMLAERLEVLSGSLRDSAGRFHWAGQLWAKKLARKISQHVAHLEGGEAWTVLTACEHVLSMPDLQRPVGARIVFDEVASAMPQAALIEAPVIAEPVHAKPLPVAKTQAEPAVDAPPPPPAELSVIMPPAEPARVHGANAANPLRDAEQRAVAADSSNMRITAVPNASAADGPIDVPSPLDMRHNVQRLRELPDRELMRLADTASRFEAAAARQVLRRRGYSDQLLELTQQLRAMPADERRQALERAAALPAADARRLLRWFVADEDADVRLHALTMLATTGDPQLSEIARRRAIEDADPRVAELATELLNTR